MKYIFLIVFVTMTSWAAAPPYADLVPSSGVFSGFSGPDSETLYLRQLLFGNDEMRMCQLVISPSFSAESTVYIRKLFEGSPREVSRDTGDVIVISRRLNENLYSLVFDELERTSGGGSYSTSPEERNKALHDIKIKAIVSESTSILDAKVFQRINGLCTKVLLRVRYQEGVGGGFDGTNYYAGHWNTETLGFYSGFASWPSGNTVVNAFVQMELALQSYAEASKNEQSKELVELQKTMDNLEARLNAADINQ